MKIQELIEALSIVDLNLDVVIDDADTARKLNIKQVIVNETHVVLENGYDDEYDSAEPVSAPSNEPITIEDARDARKKILGERMSDQEMKAIYGAPSNEQDPTEERGLINQIQLRDAEIAALQSKLESYTYTCSQCGHSSRVEVRTK